MLYPDESYRIMGACFEVHNRTGAGFLEAVYQECLAIKFTDLGIPFVAQPEVLLRYRGQAANSDLSGRFYLLWQDPD